MRRLLRLYRSEVVRGTFALTCGVALVGSFAYTVYSSRGTTRTKPHDSSDEFGRSCWNGPTEPIRKEVLLRALTRRGVRVYAEKRDVLCTGAAYGLIAEVTNYEIAGSSGGLLSCDVDRHPYRADFEQGVGWSLRTPISSSYKTKFVLANVECAIYPHGDQGARNLTALRASLEEIRGQINRNLHVGNQPPRQA